MPREAVAAHVADALALGAKEIYFTGGEPFVHPAMLEILADTLPLAPCTVLTNGTLFTERRLATLRGLSDASRFALELRVSLDGPDAARHDAIRGEGAFARTLDGLRACEAHGLLPIVTVTRLDDEPALALRERYAAMLRVAGIARPRLKLLPLFRLGREAERSGPYRASDTLAGVTDAEVAATGLQCGSCRAVTSRGVFVCPLLVDEPAARMGARFGEALGAFELRHGACLTCHVTGMTCANG
jgi:MoaA/NifB/PqqE/SkfB family radical SAM enzyme